MQQLQQPLLELEIVQPLPQQEAHPFNVEIWLHQQQQIWSGYRSKRCYLV